MNGIRRMLALSTIAACVLAGLAVPAGSAAGAAAPATVTISGTITDGSGHGYPLLTNADAGWWEGSTNSFQIRDVATDPVTGHYSMTVDADTTVDIIWGEDSAGYQQQEDTFLRTGPPGGVIQKNIVLTVDRSACDAAGYARNAAGQCAPVAGGLVAGTVSDANTGQGINGATVTAGTASTTTDPDPAWPAGSYEVFVPGSGPVSITAAKDKYVTAATTATVAADQVTAGADVAMATGRLVFTARNVTATSQLGGTKKVAVTIANTGGAPATASLSSHYGAAPAAQSASTARPQAAATRLPAAASHPSTVLISPHHRITPSPAPSGSSTRPGLHALLGKPAARPSASAGDVHSRAAADTGGWTTLPPGPGVFNPTVNATDRTFGFADHGMARDNTTGRIYAAGGVTNTSDAYPYPDLAFADTTVTSNAYMYDPVLQAWSSIAPLPEALDVPAAAFIHGKLYVAGGWAYNKVNASPTLYIYDPSTGTWSTGAPMPAGRAGAAATVMNGQLYLAGGCADQYCDNSTQDVQLYDPVTDTWQEVAPYPVPVTFGACGGIGGKLYCAGGYSTASNEGTSDAYSYDPGTNQWQAIASLPRDLWGMSYAAANGKLVVTSGITGGSKPQGTAQTLAYDPAAGTWSPLPGYPASTQFSGITVSSVYRGAMTCGLYQLGGIDTDGLTDPADFFYAMNTLYQLPGYDQCGPPDTPSWLTVTSPAEVTVPAHSEVTVTITTGGSGLQQPGPVTGHIEAYAADTPYDPAALTVTEQITPPPGWGAVTGTITAAQPCAAPPSPLHEATIQLHTGQGTITLHTGTAGHYEWWQPVPASGSPADMLISKDGYNAQHTHVRLTPGQAHPANITLTAFKCDSSSAQPNAR